MALHAFLPPIAALAAGGCQVPRLYYQAVSHGWQPRRTVHLAERKTLMSLAVSPVLVAKYFYHDCERVLRYGMVPRDERAAQGIPAGEFDASPVMQAVLQSGCAWESHVVTTHLAGRAVIAPGSATLPERRFDVGQTLALLRTLRPGQLLYQGTLRPPRSFYDRYRLDPRLVEVHDNHPDLIEVRELAGQRLLRVIDVKRGESLELTYRMQVLFYALEIDAILQAEGITDARADLEIGGVWLGGADAYEEFSLRGLRAHLEQFLREDLPRLAKAPPQKAFWHLQVRCEGCGYFRHCMNEMAASDDLSRVSKLTRHGKEHLIELGVTKVSQLRDFLARPEADEALATCASLKGEGHYLRNKARALTSGKPLPHGSACPALPVWEDVAIFLTLQREPLSRQNYLAGLFVSTAPKIDTGFLPEALREAFFPDGKARPLVLVADSPAGVPAMRQQFLDLLLGVLRAAHEHNRGRPFAEQLGLQCYVHTELERRKLAEWLFEALADPTAAEAAMTLLLFLQAPELIELDEHPDTEHPFAVVPILRSVGRLLALPVDLVYTLPETLDALGSKFTYHRTNRHHYRLAEVLQPQAVHAAWYRGEAGALEEVRKQAELYLYALRALVGEVRKAARDHLFAWPPKFRLPTIEEFRDPFLSRLAFFLRYEMLLRCQAVRDARAEPREVQLEQGTALELVASGPASFDLAGEPRMDLDHEGMGTFLLARDSEEGRRAQLRFNDLRFRDKFYGPAKQPHLAVVQPHVERDAQGRPHRLSLRQPVRFDGARASAGERFLLLPRYVDWNTKRTLDYLRQLDQEEPGLFQELLASVPAAATEKPLPADVARSVMSLQEQLRLTPSQAEAFAAIQARRVVAVWGPPGTGKTHFLAAAILGLAAAHARAGLRFRALVTGFSHFAIENVLAKALELGPMLALPGCDLAVGKAGGWRKGRPAEGESFDEESPSGWLAHRPRSLVGGTVYACMKGAETAGLLPFDLVVIDEASQVRVAEASVPASLVAYCGRLVLAGDDLQLPPIVAGEYPEPAPGRPPLHRSVFELVAAALSVPDPLARAEAAQTAPFFKMLLDNWRMNDVLTSFAARLLYGPRYQPATPAIASRRLPYKAQADASPLVRACLDAAHPLVVVLIDGVRATSENEIEADMVRDLALALRAGLCDDEGGPYTSDKAFFEQGLFIVCPHRAQNRLVRRRLAEARTWSCDPVSDTVDKMQGQESDAVIVSYGVADPEYAALEAEFIYGRNRLNVAITRARSKCVVLLSQSLLTASPGVLDVPEAAEGLAFMRGLAQLVLDNGERLEIDAGQGVPLTVLRCDKPVPIGY